MPFRFTSRLVAVVLLIGLAAPPSAAQDPADDPASPPPAWTAGFEATLDSLAVAHGIPGLAAVVVRDGRIAWTHGFGYADIEAGTPATADTPFRLASLTKPIAATVLMQLVEAGRLSLDEPMGDLPIHSQFEPGGGSWAHYPERYADGAITVRHVLTHTSQSTPPGEEYAYNGNIFGDLTFVLEGVTRRSYPDFLRERIIDRLGMTRSLPGPMVPWGADVLTHLAKPYQQTDSGFVAATHPGFVIEPGRDVTSWHLDPAYRIPASTVDARRAVLGPRYTSLHSAITAAGMIASASDLARFDIAFDGGRLVTKTARQAMFTAARSSTGKVLPYGLGWFVEDHDGRQVIWHYGWHPPTISALYVKLPDERLTFIVLANSDGLSAGMSWTAEGVRASPFARLFLERTAEIRAGG